MIGPSFCHRIRAAVGAGALLVGLIAPMALPAQVDSAELLKNAGFDEELDGKGLPRHWSVSRDRTIWREAGYLSKNVSGMGRIDRNGGGTQIRGDQAVTRGTLTRQ